MANTAEEEAKENEASSSHDERVVWARNAKVLYDVWFARRLEWSSLVVEWLPGVTKGEEEGSRRHELLVGTHASTGEPNSLQLLSVTLPSAETEIDTTKDFGRDLTEDARAFSHPGGEANRVRHKNATLFASKCANGLVYVYDKQKSEPTATLRGHDDEGYGLAWDPSLSSSLLASAAYDGTLCLFDVEVAKAAATSRGAHGGLPIGDVAYAPKKTNFLATAGDDRRVLFWDPRTLSSPSSALSAHEGDINAVSFAAREAVVEEHFFVTGSSDRTLKLWDLRSLSKPLHASTLSHDVVVAHWAPFGAAFVAAVAGNRASIFDFSKLGADDSDVRNAKGFLENDDDLETTPELVMEHAGHSAKLTDLSWNLAEDALAASVADDNTLQVWWLASDLYDDGNDYDFFDTLPSSFDDEALKDSSRQSKRQKTDAL